MAKQKCISLFDDQLEVVSFLDDEQLGRVVRAAMQFMRDGTDASFDGCEGMFYRVLLAQFVRQQIDQKNGLAGANARIEKIEEASQETHREESRKNRREIRGVQEGLNQIQPSLEIKETNVHPYSAAKPSRLSGEDFETFWRAYPRKESKAQARKSFVKVTVPVETLLQALETQKQSDQWKRNGGQYIPYASTWIKPAALGRRSTHADRKGRRTGRRLAARPPGLGRSINLDSGCGRDMQAAFGLYGGRT